MTGSMSMVFCFGLILMCQVAVHGSAEMSMSVVSVATSETAVVSSGDNTLVPSSFLPDKPSAASDPDPTVTTPNPLSMSLHSYYIQREYKVKTSSIKHSSILLARPVSSEKHHTGTTEKRKFPSGNFLSSGPGLNEGSINSTNNTRINPSRSTLVISSTSRSSATLTATNENPHATNETPTATSENPTASRETPAASSNTPQLLIQSGDRLNTQAGKHSSGGVSPLVVPLLTSAVTATPTLSVPQVESSSAARKRVSRKRNTNGMFLEKLVQNTRPDTTESPPLSGEYIAIIILSILCGVVLMMIIIYILCKNRCGRLRFQVVTIICDEDLSSSEVSLENGVPDGDTNMLTSASVSLDGTGQTSFISTDEQNSSLENSQLEATAQTPSNQDMRQNNMTEFRHVIQSDYMDLSYFTSGSDKEGTDTLNKAGDGGLGSGNSPAIKDDESKPAENLSSNSISTDEARVVYANDKPATGTLKRPKLFYDKYGYTLVIKNGDDQFRLAEESDQTNRLKESTSNPHNHGVDSKVGHTATVSSPVSKQKSKTLHENVLLPKTKLVERLVGSSQTDRHAEEANHKEDSLVSPKIETHAFNHYLDLYSQIDGCGKNGEMVLLENLSTETEGKQSGEAHLQNTDTDTEHADRCDVNTATTTTRNVLLESLDILQRLQEVPSTPPADASSDDHSSGEDTSPEEDIDIMAYMGDYVPPKKTYLGIIYEYEEDVEFDELDKVQSSESDGIEKEESANQQVVKEQANSLKQESCRMKMIETMKEVNTAKQEGIEDEDGTVGNLEILHSHQMDDENQLDTKGVQKEVQGEGKADSLDKHRAGFDATKSCSELVDYQRLMQTMEGDVPAVDRDDHTYLHDLQGKVMYTTEIGNRDVQWPEAIKSEQSDEPNAGDEPLVVEQEVSQDVAEEIAQQVVEQDAQEVVGQVAQEVSVEISEEVVEEVSEEVGGEVAQGVAEEVVEEVALEVVEEVSEECVQKFKERKAELEKGAEEIEEANTEDECNVVGNEQAEKDEELDEVKEGENQQIPGIPDDTAEQKDEESRDITEDRLVAVNSSHREEGEEENEKGEAQSDAQEKEHKVYVIDHLENEHTDDAVHDSVKEHEEEEMLEIENQETMKFQHETEGNNNGQAKKDEDFDEYSKSTIIEEAETDKPRNEQVLEGQDEMTETNTNQQIQENLVRTGSEPKEVKAAAGIQVIGDEQEKLEDEEEKEKCIEDKPYDTAGIESQTTDIANSKQVETQEDQYDVGNAEMQQSSDGGAVQETTEGVIHLDVKTEVAEENQHEEGKMKEKDEQHEATENNDDHCDGSSDILFLNAEEEDEDEYDDDGWMDLDEPISMVLAACQFSSIDDSDTDEMDCEDAQPLVSSCQDEAVQALDNCFVRDYIERLQFLKPTKGILCKERETGAITGGKRVSKNVRFILPDEWNTC